MAHRIYMAGKITGDSNYLAKFADWSERFRAEGWEVINPAAVTALVGTDDRAACMRMDIPLLLTCDAAFFMRDWRDSPGARVEHDIARITEMRVIYEPIDYAELVAEGVF